ncbi:hypothetical protein GCM10027416_00860 [Okibacterium endophyticum]
MAASGLADDALRRFADRLRHDRRELERQREHIADSLRQVRAARDGEHDDEHDPEGPTVAAEWSRATGLQAGAEAALRSFDAALARIDAGVFGVCVECGEPIGEARLDAWPSAERCIACARIAEASARRRR